MLITSENYVCLECGCEYENDLNIAVCPKCLEKEVSNYKAGIPSKYHTVNHYIRDHYEL